ncbi:MAG: hypothetical protein KDA05_09820 [Phycisphaerales bacterium]|nr:hypothetical protein [Phycisphaerales bacterium]
MKRVREPMANSGEGRRVGMLVAIAGRARALALAAGVGLVAAPVLGQPATPPGQGDLTSGSQPPATPGDTPPAPPTGGQDTPGALPPGGGFDLSPEDTLMLIQEPTPADGEAYRIGRIDAVYDVDNPGFPPIEELRNVAFELLELPEGFVRPRENLPTVTVTLAQLSEMPTRTMYASAIDSALRAIVEHLNRNRQILGAFATVDELDLANSLDNRDEGQTGITIRVLAARVTEIRTLGSGERVPQDDRRIDNPAHTRIIERSPVAAGGAGGGGLLRRDLIDEYVLRLNRHPGRRVDVAVAPGDPEDGVGAAVLDYLVYEAKPWSVYFNVSNTGTEQTNEWRERFGFVHNQLTGNDDILTIDYVTAGFDAANSIEVGYDAPLFDSERLRWHIRGGWNEYTASDIGQLGDFNGEGYFVDAGLSWNIYQHRELFIDLLGGVRFENFEVDPPPPSTGGDESLWFPYIGVFAERSTDRWSFSSLARLDLQPSGDETDLATLGRLDVDGTWAMLRGEANVSVFLDPFFYGSGWDTINEDVRTDRDSTLAHEVLFSLRGQTSFGARLIPQAQEVAGGLYTVRGYDESIVAGDDAIIFTAEYQFHLPRAFAIEPEPTARVWGRPFKVSPQQPFGRPDWDWIFRAFLDVGHTIEHGSVSSEGNETLVGAGVGTEIQFMRNAGLRLDLGFALQDAGPDDDLVAESGDARLHVLFSLLF